jgi:ABC-type Zn2+ transport system substrate-binding protein/surface adhesin
MNQFLSRVLLSIFLLAALPLQTIAAVNALACAGDHGSEHASVAVTNSSDQHDHASLAHSDAKAAATHSHDTPTPSGFTCGHGAPCCFGAALIASMQSVIAGNEVNTQFPVVIVSYPAISPSTLERPPRKHLA